MERATLVKIVGFLLHTLTHSEYIGAENLPETGGVIMATNHLSQLDTPLLMLNPSRPDITALVTTKYQQFWFMRWFITVAQGIWIDRSKADFTAFRMATEELHKGKVLGIAPEGTRSQDYGLLQGKPGTILLAIKSDVPIVPVAITGTETGFHEIFRLRKPHFTVRVGRAFHLPPVNRENRDESMQQLTDEVMCRIAVMLPEKYWGFYRNHPRLQELLLIKDELLAPDASRVIL